ncbi:hypothetical protein Tcan_08354 [Toxocara canis]|uniref:Uncharacterized protein n=1 Tax=Toxocara canis TaxID=6265 RepID=A0A0B2W0Q0_TOXCA|nr:hypothetical protein Tcan_08354 [Toxocara canis]
MVGRECFGHHIYIGNDTVQLHITYDSEEGSVCSEFFSILCPKIQTCKYSNIRRKSRAKYIFTCSKYNVTKEDCQKPRDCYLKTFDVFMDDLNQFTRMDVVCPQSNERWQRQIRKGQFRKQTHHSHIRSSHLRSQNRHSSSSNHRWISQLRRIRPSNWPRRKR